MQRGRPIQSSIREKITAIIEKLQLSYGYEIYKYYKQYYDNATSRVIYYHLKKGSSTGEFITVNVKRIPGYYTWGDETERIYYALGPFAKTKQEWTKKISSINNKSQEIDFDWLNEIKKRTEELKKQAKTTDKTEKQKITNKCDKLINWSNKKLQEPKEIIEEINSIKTLLK